VTRLNERDYFYLKFVPVFELRLDVQKLDLKFLSLL
jgi:hypothetical protein